MTLPLEEKRNRVLVTAYELNSKSPHIDVDELEQLADVGIEFFTILRYFGVNGKNWLKKTNMVVRLTAEGIDAAEEVLKTRQVQMAETEKVVLRKIYDLGGPTHTAMVGNLALEQELGMTFPQMNPVLRCLKEERRWISSNDQAVWLLSTGVREVERVEKTEETVPHIVIYNPTNSPMSFGANSSQTVTYNNQPVKEIIPELLELITAVHQLDFPTKEDVLDELTKVQALAESEMNEGKWQIIQSRLVTAKTALDIAQIVAHSIPYWPAVWNYFFKYK